MERRSGPSRFLDEAGWGDIFGLTGAIWLVLAVFAWKGSALARYDAGWWIFFCLACAFFAEVLALIFEATEAVCRRWPD